jgi:hypothetical protein
MLFEKNIHQQPCDNKHYHLENHNHHGEFALQDCHLCEALQGFFISRFMCIEEGHHTWLSFGNNNYSFNLKRTLKITMRRNCFCRELWKNLLKLWKTTGEGIVATKWDAQKTSQEKGSKGMSECF